MPVVNMELANLLIINEKENMEDSKPPNSKE